MEKNTNTMGTSPCTFRQPRVNVINFVLTDKRTSGLAGWVRCQCADTGLLHPILVLGILNLLWKLHSPLGPQILPTGGVSPGRVCYQRVYTVQFLTRRKGNNLFFFPVSLSYFLTADIPGTELCSLIKLSSVREESTILTWFYLILL